MNAAISIKNLGKCYRIYEKPVHRLLQTLFPWRILHQEFWALRNVDLTVGKGETIGIIGQNGSGKSTLLQLICGTLTPTQGSIAVHGRVAALLELGAGFNPEFTGRENALMTAALHGIDQATALSLLGDIADFADIGAFFDRPVKTYSSGMFVRLAFAANTCFQPEILIVDEALSVGDSAFQLKCFERMKSLQANGATIILVSHDMQTVRSFCQKAIWIHSGEIMAYGDTADVTSSYSKFVFEQKIANIRDAQSKAPESGSGSQRSGIAGKLALRTRSELQHFGSGEIKIVGVAINNSTDGNQVMVEHGSRLRIDVEAEVISAVASDKVGVAISIQTKTTQNIICVTSFDEGVVIAAPGSGQRIYAQFELENILSPGTYILAVAVDNNAVDDLHYYDFIRDVMQLVVVSDKKIHSIVHPRAEVRVELLDQDGPQ